MSTGLRLTAAEYDRMVEKGAFTGLSGKIELIYGEITQMNPAGPFHGHLIAWLTAWSYDSINRDRLQVRVQTDLNLPDSDSRPEPDVMWVAAGIPGTRHPTGADVRLLIEVSVSSLSHDRSTKAALYAESGISEYWIVDADHECIHVYQDPSPIGYESLRTVKRGESVSPLTEPTAVLSVSDIFQQ